MNARSWMTWCSATMLSAAALAGEETSTPPSINYSMAVSGLPAPAFLNKLKPTAIKTEPKPVVIVSPPPIPPAEKPVPQLVPRIADSFPALPNKMKSTPDAAVEPAIVNPGVAPTPMPIMPVGAYLPSVDDHVKCVGCLKTLSGSPIESDRKAALDELGKLTAWKQMKTAYMILRRVALTEYNTKMRADAVRLLGESMMEHALAADTLKLSAQYDSDVGIRTAALAQLERLASLPPDRIVR